MVFHWSLSDRKSLQVTRTSLSILTDLKNTVFWIVLTCSLISKSSNPLTKPLGIVLNPPIAITISVTLIFHSFFLVLWQGLRTYHYFPFLLFLLCGLPKRQSQLFSKFFFLLFTTTRSGRLVEIRGSVCISKSHRNLCVSSSWTDFGKRINYICAWSNLNFFHHFQWIIFAI